MLQKLEAKHRRKSFWDKQMEAKVVLVFLKQNENVVWIDTKISNINMSFSPWLFHKKILLPLQIQRMHHSFQQDKCHSFGHCTALKATGLLSCLQMKITSFRMKLKWMQCLREVQLEILGAVLSLLRWTMLLREESACQLHSSLWLCCTTTARVNEETEQNVFCHCNGLKDIAVAMHRPASADARSRGHGFYP